MKKSRRNPIKSNYNTKDSSNNIYLNEFINEIEKESLKKSKQLKIQNLDLSYNLPKDIYNKVNKILKLEKRETDHFEEEQEIINVESVNTQKANDIKTRQKFNESTLSEVLDKELKFMDIDLYIEPKAKPRKSQQEKKNWLAEYLTKPKKDRIVWPTKLYNCEKKFLEKSLYEQAEELMDLSAEEFTDWINALSSDNKSNLNKDLIKQLFAIGIEGDASKALYVEPKQIKAVPHAVAESFQLPEMAIENNVARMLALDKRLENKQEKMIAFGTSLPENIKEYKKGTDVVQQLKPIFPDDIKTSKIIFNGITHLRSTKALINYLNDNPDIPKPDFLIENNAFKQKSQMKEHKTYIPLYEHIFENK